MSSDLHKAVRFTVLGILLVSVAAFSAAHEKNPATLAPFLIGNCMETETILTRHHLEKLYGANLSPRPIIELGANGD